MQMSFAEYFPGQNSDQVERLNVFLQLSRCLIIQLVIHTSNIASNPGILVYSFMLKQSLTFFEFGKKKI